MTAQIEQDKDRFNLVPKKFVVWLFVFTSFMIFAALTSGFIVYAGGSGHALNVILPVVFAYSTALIMLSSVTMFMASQAAKRLEVARQRLFLWLTMALGVMFFAVQLYGWYVLTVKMGIYFVNPNKLPNRFIFLCFKRRTPAAHYRRFIIPASNAHNRNLP